MGREKNCKKIVITMTTFLLISNILIIMPSENVSANSYNGEDLALAILANNSWLVSSSYTDTDQSGCRQATVLTSLGTMTPTNGNNFALLSTGIAGASIITTDGENPGDERGSWFSGGQYGYPRDEATLTMTLNVPMYMHYLYYDVQFFSSEYPEYVGTQYNDKLTVTVNSPSQGTSNYVFDVNSGYFILDSNDIPETGFDIFARSGYPGGVDWVDRSPRSRGADAGASDLIPIGGVNHPVSPNEQITVTFNIKDSGDNMFDSAAFIDNLMFTGYARTDILARKNIEDINGGEVESGDILKYTVTISNTGSADQNNNPGNEFEDNIPENTQYISGSISSTSGSINYDADNEKITWNGEIPGESSVSLSFKVTVDSGLSNGTVISNQGTVYWDSTEDGINDATELTDNPHIDDGIDQDGDGDTEDDDPTNVSVISFEAPSSVTEDFSDDSQGGIATQNYRGRQWFETTGNKPGSKFSVSSGYYYSTDKSYKTQIRADSGPMFWNYSFTNIESTPKSWEVWFKCGDASETHTTYLKLKNSLGEDITKIKLEYTHDGDEFPFDWLLKLYIWDPDISSWTQLYSDYTGGFLRNNWYKIHIKNNDVLGYLDCSLNKTGVGMLDSTTVLDINALFSDLSYVEFTSNTNSVVCPMFFWDEHKITFE